jgi:flagellar biosynthesis protein FlhG
VRIIPVASGKGGVGKSLVSANLSIALAQAGKRVVLADLDLGASNLHLILGFRAYKNGLGTYLSAPRYASRTSSTRRTIPTCASYPATPRYPAWPT